MQTNHRNEKIDTEITAKNDKNQIQIKRIRIIAFNWSSILFGSIDHLPGQTAERLIGAEDEQTDHAAENVVVVDVVLPPAPVQLQAFFQVDFVGGVDCQRVAETGEIRKEVHEEDGNHYPEIITGYHSRIIIMSRFRMPCRE
jgi:hypothetical protein